jgi:subtilase family serine protease
VPALTSRVAANGRLAATNQLRLAIGVPLRDAAGLGKFLADVYDPASPNFRNYLTPEEFTARFGPTVADYNAVKNFARTSGLTITATHGNRLLLDVIGSAAAVEKAFHVSLRTYLHPTENRNFYAPDVEPTVAAGLPLADISGLDNFSRPRPKVQLTSAPTLPLTTNAPHSGTGPSFYGFPTFIGSDFRHAYAPGTSLTGAGQMVGLVQFDGFYASDIASYKTLAGLPDVPVETVLLDGYDGSSGGGNVEVSLDIEMAISMAPGLAKIVVFTAGPTGNPNDVLNSMAAHYLIKNLSCSWGWSGGPDATTENIFLQMAAQGQSFFNASGDVDAFTAGQVDDPNFDGSPSSSPNVIQVGGTSLGMNGAGESYLEENVWNQGGGQGSSGGISSYYTMPVWQQGINMMTNGGSTTQRNMPDVALTADYVYVIYGGGSSGKAAGTSCAAPLWAGFMALVNQQAGAVGRAPIGFANPAIYTIGKSTNYLNCFHDTTTGNNFSPASPTNFPATTGYDLCTGWGTPTGTNLINALVGLADSLGISPAGNLSYSTFVGPFFITSSQNYVLTNSGSSPCDWQITNAPAWLNLQPAFGTLPPGAQTNMIVSLKSSGSNLAIGSYHADILFSNLTTAVGQLRPVDLQVTDPLQISPAISFTASGPVGGPFTQNLSAYVLNNAGPITLNWSLMNSSAWLNVFPTNGNLSARGAPVTVSLNLTALAASLSAGIYSATVLFTNRTSHVAQPVSASLNIGQSIVQNGGFETGDFTGWTLVGNTISGGYVYNSVENILTTPGAVHAGSYGAFLGDTQLATLSQNLTTIPGQNYLISFWLDNPVSGAGQTFLLNGNTNSPAANQIFYLSSPPVLAWTNLTFVLTAAGTNTVLQFGAENQPNFFGLDDVAVTPIPAPTVTSFKRTTNALSFRWNSLAGVAYQVQYKTNLFQSGWLNLGSPLTATAATTSVTNVYGPDRERYYRIRQLP